MASKTQIGNVALVRLGVTKMMANIDTEASSEARALRVVFDDERDFVLRDFAWSFAKQIAALALVDGSETEMTNYDYQYAYRVPSDCVMARRLSTSRGGRQDPEPPAFELGQDADGLLLFTDEANAVLEYTKRVTDVGRWDPIFRSALSWRLATQLAPSNTRIKNVIQLCNEQYGIEIDKARSRSLNERQADKPMRSELERVRD